MTERQNNYQIQAMQAKKRFLTYDQQELIARCGLRFDGNFLYLTMLSEPYRIHRRTGDMERCHGGIWVDGNSFNEVTERTILSSNAWQRNYKSLMLLPPKHWRNWWISIC